MACRCARGILLLGLLAMLAGCGSAVSSAPTPIPSSTGVPSPTPPGPVLPAAPGIYLEVGDGSLAALNLSDGAQRWQQEHAVNYNSQLALDHAVVYASVGQAVAAFNASDGVQRWKTTLVDPNSPNGADVDRLLVANGVVYVGTEQFLNALNASDGTLLWRSAQPVGPVINLAISGNTLYVNNGSLQALSTKDGAQLWGYFSGVNGPVGTHLSTMALVNGTLFTADTGRLDGTAYVFAVDAKTGKERWHSRLGNASASYQEAGVIGLALENSRVYVSEMAASTANLYALESGTGKPLWRFPLPSGARYITAPAAANGLVYVSATGAAQQVGVIYALNANDGSLRWHVITGGPAARNALARRPRAIGPARPLSGGPLIFAPLVLNGLLYVRAESRVYALAAASGQQQWLAEPGGAAFDAWAIG